jgi:hypothetical protein
VGRLVFEPLPPGDPKQRKPDITRARTLLGWEPKVPLEVGVHKLIVIDGDGKGRLLSVTIEAAKTNELRGIDVSSLPLAP